MIQMARPRISSRLLAGWCLVLAAISACDEGQVILRADVADSDGAADWAGGDWTPLPDWGDCSNPLCAIGIPCDQDSDCPGGVVVCCLDCTYFGCCDGFCCMSATCE